MPCARRRASLFLALVDMRSGKEEHTLQHAKAQNGQKTETVCRCLSLLFFELENMKYMDCRFSRDGNDA